MCLEKLHCKLTFLGTLIISGLVLFMITTMVTFEDALPLLRKEENTVLKAWQSLEKEKVRGKWMGESWKIFRNTNQGNLHFDK